MLVSLTGLISSGKDTVADHLVQNHNFIQLSFAGSLKDALSVIFGWNREMLEGKTKEHRELRNQVDHWWSNELDIPNFTPRLAMTKLGTDVLRKHFNDQIWVHSLKNKINQLKEINSDTRIVISDARYVNELNMIRAINGHLIVIKRGDLPFWWGSAFKYNRLNSEYKKKLYELYCKYISLKENIFTKNIHSSEYDWIGYNFDQIFFNNDTIDALTELVDLYIKPRLEN